MQDKIGKVIPENTTPRLEFVVQGRRFERCWIVLEWRRGYF